MTAILSRYGYARPEDSIATTSQILIIVIQNLLHWNFQNIKIQSVRIVLHSTDQAITRPTLRSYKSSLQ